MGDIFKEQLVKRKPNAADSVKKIAVIVLALLIVLVFFTVPVLQGFFLPVAALLSFGVYYAFSFFHIEYEYAFTNGELDIDIIYNRARRKRIYSGMVKDFEIMAHVNDENHFDSHQEIRDYSSGVIDSNTYAFLTYYKGKKIKFIIEPNDMMLQAIATVLTPRKLIRK